MLFVIKGSFPLILYFSVWKYHRLPRQSDKSKTFNERALFSILLTKFFDMYKHPKDSFSNWQEAVICTRTSSSLLPEFWHLDKSKCFNWFPFEKFVLPLKKNSAFPQLPKVNLTLRMIKIISSFLDLSLECYQILS